MWVAASLVSLPFVSPLLKFQFCRPQRPWSIPRRLCRLPFSRPLSIGQSSVSLSVRSMSWRRPRPRPPKRWRPPKPWRPWKKPSPWRPRRAIRPPRRRAWPRKPWRSWRSSASSQDAAPGFSARNPGPPACQRASIREPVESAVPKRSRPSDDQRWAARGGTRATAAYCHVSPAPSAFQGVISWCCIAHSAFHVYSLSHDVVQRPVLSILISWCCIALSALTNKLK